MRRFFPGEVLFFLAAWIANAVIFRARGFHDPGTLWHVRVGERILSDGIMRTDPFTFTFQGRTWIPQQWGGEVLMAVAHGVGGLDALLLGFSLMIAGIFTAIFRWLRFGGMQPPLAAVVAGFAMVAAGFHFYIRPHLVTIVFSALLMNWLISIDRSHIRLRWIGWLVPLHLLWTNLHGGMLGGVATLSLAAAGWTMSWLIGNDSPVKDRNDVGRLAVIVALCGLTMFVNPIGLELQRTWLRIVGSDSMAKYVTEHSPMNLTREVDRAVVAFAVFYLLIVMGAPWREWRVTWILPIVWFLLTLKGIRHGPIFVVLAAVSIADIWPRTRWHRWLLQSGDLLVRPVRIPLPAMEVRSFALPIGFIVLALLFITQRIPVPVVGHGWARLDSPNTMPLDLLEPIREYANSAPRDTPIYNDLNFGGFLIYFAPTLKIFADDRFELCGDAWLEDYVHSIAHRPERIDEWQQQYGFTHALIAHSDPALPLESYLDHSPRWERVAVGRSAILFRVRGDK